MSTRRSRVGLTPSPSRPGSAPPRPPAARSSASAPASGTSGNSDRHDLPRQPGKVYFGVYPAASRPSAPPRLQQRPVAPRRGHLGPDGMKLYVDGALVGSQAGITSPDQQRLLAGRRRLHVRLAGQPAADQLYAGDIDNAAVYNYVLSPSRSRPTAPRRPTGPGGPLHREPTDLTAAVDGSRLHRPRRLRRLYAWDYGDGSTGTGATASHTYAAPGTYPVTLTVTDENGGTDTTTSSPSAAPTPPRRPISRPPATSWISTSTGPAPAIPTAPSPATAGTSATGSTGTGATVVTRTPRAAPTASP